MIEPSAAVTPTPLDNKTTVAASPIASSPLTPHGVFVPPSDQWSRDELRNNVPQLKNGSPPKLVAKSRKRKRKCTEPKDRSQSQTPNDPPQRISFGVRSAKQQTQAPTPTHWSVELEPDVASTPIAVNPNAVNPFNWGVLPINLGYLQKLVG